MCRKAKYLSLSRYTEVFFPFFLALTYFLNNDYTLTSFEREKRPFPPRELSPYLDFFFLVHITANNCMSKSDLTEIFFPLDGAWVFPHHASLQLPASMLCSGAAASSSAVMALGLIYWFHSCQTISLIIHLFSSAEKHKLFLSGKPDTLQANSLWDDSWSHTLVCRATQSYRSSEWFYFWCVVFSVAVFHHKLWVLWFGKVTSKIWPDSVLVQCHLMAELSESTELWWWWCGQEGPRGLVRLCCILALKVSHIRVHATTKIHCKWF